MNNKTTPVDWQPIETAPANTSIMLGGKSVAPLIVNYYDKTRESYIFYTHWAPPLADPPEPSVFKLFWDDQTHCSCKNSSICTNRLLYGEETKKRVGQAIFTAGFEAGRKAK